MAVVIPAMNEGTVLGAVLRDLRAHCPDATLVVVDDGSADDTSDVALAGGAHVLRHVVNLGTGAATKTGFDYAVGLGVDVIVRFDADGQFDASDVALVAAPVIEGRADVVLGTRFGSVRPDGMPPARRLLLRCATAYTRLTTGLGVTDTHTGLRAFSREAASRIELTQNRMAYASEILTEIGRLGLRWVEQPVHVRYTDYSRAKGQRGWGALDILFDLAGRDASARS